MCRCTPADSSTAETSACRCNGSGFRRARAGHSGSLPASADLSNPPGVEKKEELFQIVTENTADMIALVDVKGRRLYNSPAYKRIQGYSAAELGETSAFEQIHPDDRFRVLDAAREARETGTGKRLAYRIKH